MPLQQVLLSNTFNEFRQSVNDISNTVNAIQAGTGPVSANTLTAANLTQNRVVVVGASGQLIDDADLTYNPSTNALTGNSLNLTSTTESTTTSTGALVVAGGVGIGGRLNVGGRLDVSGNTVIDGNLVVNGNTITLNVTNLDVEDTFIYLNANSTISNPDLGFAGNYNDGTYRHAGVFRDASDGKFKFFDSYTPEPTNPIDVNHASFSLADVAIDNLEATNVTLSGNITVNTNKFTVNATSGNTSVAGTLGVTGITSLSDVLNVTGNLNINTNKFNVTASSGNTAIAGTLAVTGGSTLTGAVTAQSTLGVTGDFSVNTNKFTVNATSGNASIAGTLGVTGDVAINTNKFNVTASSGNTSIAGTLAVTGATTINNNLGVTGNVVLGDTSSDTLTVNGGTLTLGTNLNINSGKYYFDQANTRIGINTSTPTVSLHINTTDGITMPVGTTAQRPGSAGAGTFRYNSESAKAEIYDGTNWKTLGGGVDLGQIYFYSSFTA